MPMTIRAERREDFDAIAHVVAAAFESHAEADLVTAIRASEHYVADWSLVAEIDGEIVGHVMVSWCPLHSERGTRRVPMLSPLAVAPDRHGQGIGSQLVVAVTRLVDEAGEALVVLQGDPRYYSRFGFEPAGPRGIEQVLPDWAPPEASQLLRLAAYDPGLTGRLELPPAFTAVEDR